MQVPLRQVVVLDKQVANWHRTPCLLLAASALHITVLKQQFPLCGTLYCAGCFKAFVHVFDEHLHHVVVLALQELVREAQPVHVAELGQVKHKVKAAHKIIAKLSVHQRLD